MLTSALSASSTLWPTPLRGGDGARSGAGTNAAGSGDMTAAAAATAPGSSADGARSPSSTGSRPTASAPNGKPLSDDEQKQVQELKRIDDKVRAHEMAHLAAAGGLATSGVNYSYTRGPDGVQYATGGDVGIDTSEGRTPQETLGRAQQIRSAALAPADPSPQDRAVAAKATQMEAKARGELSAAAVGGNSTGRESGQTPPAANTPSSAEPSRRSARGLAAYAQATSPTPMPGSLVHTAA